MKVISCSSCNKVTNCPNCDGWLWIDELKAWECPECAGYKKIDKNDKQEN